MKRVAMMIGTMSLLPLLLGAGGGAPPPPFPTKIAGQTFKASVVLDPHNAGVTSTAGQGSIRISRDPHLAAGLFRLPALGFPLNHGCDLSLTNTRFLNRPLTDWIPEDVVEAMFKELGITVGERNEPVITRIEQAACTPDPENPTVNDPTHPDDLPGILSFQADVRFRVPK